MSPLKSDPVKSFPLPAKSIRNGITMSRIVTVASHLPDIESGVAPEAADGIAIPIHSAAKATVLEIVICSFLSVRVFAGCLGRAPSEGETGAGMPYRHWLRTARTARTGVNRSPSGTDLVIYAQRSTSSRQSDNSATRGTRMPFRDRKPGLALLARCGLAARPADPKT